MAEILNFKGEDVGENFYVAPDAVLQAAIGNLKEVVVCGIGNDGSIYLAGSKGDMHTLWLLRAGEHVLFRNAELTDG